MGASAVLKLQKAGFSIEQVEALADFMDTQAASKADLEREGSSIRAELAQESSSIRTEMERGFATARAELVHESSSIRAEVAGVKTSIELLRRDMTLLRSEIVNKLGGMLVVIAGLLLAAIHYLTPGH